MDASIDFSGVLRGSIADGGGGGGGDSVVITPVVTSGTKIADVTVNGVEKDLYCPTPTEVSVSQVQQSGTKIASIEVNGQSVDLYAPTPSAPTEVSVTQVQQSGTKIATIGVNGQNTDIYAPNGGGDNYSSDEVEDGTWFGAKRYRKTFNISVAPPYSIIDVSSLNINQLVNFEGVAMSSNSDVIMIPYCVTSGNQYLDASYSKSENRIYMSMGDSLSTYSNVYLTIWYTKNS